MKSFFFKGMVGAVAMSALVGVFLPSCGGSGSDSGENPTGNIQSLTVESMTVTSSTFPSGATPTVTASVDTDGSLLFTVDPVEIDGSWYTPTIESVTMEPYAGDAMSLDASADESWKAAVTLECKDRGSASSSVAVLGDELGEVFVGKSCGYDGGGSGYVRRIDCPAACADYNNSDQGRYLYAVIVGMSALGYDYESIVNAVIFLLLTC